MPVPERFQFRLRDLFLITLAVAVVLGSLRFAGSSLFISLFSAAAIYAVAMAVGHWLVRRPDRYRLANWLAGGVAGVAISLLALGMVLVGGEALGDDFAVAPILGLVIAGPYASAVFGLMAIASPFVRRAARSRRPIGWPLLAPAGVLALEAIYERMVPGDAIRADLLLIFPVLSAAVIGGILNWLDIDWHTIQGWACSVAPRHSTHANKTMPSLIDSPKTLILAHRGNSRAAPENTLPAFESALNLGVDLVELDYHHTADGVPVVFHDEELDRCTDACHVWGGANQLLARRTWAELQQLDAGGWFGEAFRGTHIATLEDALRLICPRAGCMIERKSGDAATCVALLRRLSVLDRCVVTAFDWPFLAECHRLAPELLLGALGTDALTPDRLTEAQQTGARVIGWDNDVVTEEHVRLVHSHGLKAWVWTVDEPLRAEELTAWGVDGLISNVPGEIQSVIR